MKTKCIFSLLLVLWFISGFAQQNKAVPVKLSSQEANVSLISNNEEIVRLKEENQKLKSKLDELDKEVDIYREDVRSNLADFHDKITHWLTWLSILYALLSFFLGIVAPWYINEQNTKHLDDKLDLYFKLLGDKVNAATSQAENAKNQAEQAKAALKDIEEVKSQVDEIEKIVGEASQTATNQAELAKATLKDIEDVKTQVDEIEKEVGKASEKAIIAAKEAYASQLYSEALAEEDPSMALKLYDRVLSMDPNHSSAYYYRGRTKTKLGDTHGALNDYTKSIELNPNLSKAYNNRGLIKKKTGDITGAMDDYDKAIEVDPCCSSAYCNRGNLKKLKGDYEEALKDYAKAIEINPNKSLYYRNRASCYDRLCETETDEKVITGYQNIAKADRKKAEELDTEVKKNKHDE